MAQAHVVKGQKAFDSENYTKAESEYRQAIAEQPEATLPKLKLASVLERTKRVNQAIELLNSITISHPDEFRSFNMLGLIHEDLGQYQQAKSFYRQAINVCPNAPASYHYLGLQLITERSYEEAAEILDVAFHLDRRDVRILTSLATVCLAQGKFDAAIGYLDRINREKTDFDTALGIALIYQICAIKERSEDILRCSQQYLKHCFSMKWLDTNLLLSSVKVFSTYVLLSVLRWVS